MPRRFLRLPRFPNGTITRLIGVFLLLGLGGLGSRFARGSESPYALFGTHRQSAGPVTWESNADRSAIMEAILEAWARDDELSASVLISFKGEVVLERAFGWADREAKIPLRSTMALPASFAGMQVTAAAIGRLADQGKLSLDQSLEELLPPPFPPHIGNVTLKHLLTTSSGLDQNWLRSTPKTSRDNFKGFDELLSILVEVPKRSEPGERRVFSGEDGQSTDYELLGVVIEQVSGKSYEQFVRQEIFNPLGLASSSFLAEQDGKPQPVRLYQKLFEEWERYPTPSFSHGRSVTGVRFTARDLYDFLKAMRPQSKRFGPKTLEAYRLATVVEVDGQPYADQNGWSWGATVAFGHFTSEDHAFILLSNLHRAAEIYDIRRRWARLTREDPVGLPLPRVRRDLWNLLQNEGALPASRLLTYYRKRGIGADLPLPDLYQFHSRELRRRKRYREAREITRLYILTQPDFWLPYREMGEVERMSGDHDSAAKLFEKALSMKPDDPTWKRDMEDFLRNRKRR